MISVTKANIYIYIYIFRDTYINTSLYEWREKCRVIVQISLNLALEKNLQFCNQEKGRTEFGLANTKGVALA